MLKKEDEKILRNFDKVLARKALKDRSLTQLSLRKEGALGPRYKGKISRRGLEAGFGEEFKMITHQGNVLHRKDMVEGVANVEPDVEFKEGTIETLDSFGRTAWMTGQLTIKAVIDGQNITGRYRSSGVFVKRKGVWQMVLSHLSPIVPGGKARPKGKAAKKR